MTRHFLVGAIVVAIINGIFSPYLLSVFLFYPLWYPTSWAPAITEAVVAVASILLSTLTLMVAAVPAAISERVRGLHQTDEVSALVWFAGTLLLSLPAVPPMLRLAGMN
jgi:hypothetical protein